MHLWYLQSVLHHIRSVGTFVFTDTTSVHKTFLPAWIKVLFLDSSRTEPHNCRLIVTTNFFLRKTATQNAFRIRTPFCNTDESKYCKMAATICSRLKLGICAGSRCFGPIPATESFTLPTEWTLSENLNLKFVNIIYQLMDCVLFKRDYRSSVTFQHYQFFFWVSQS